MIDSYVALELDEKDKTEESRMDTILHEKGRRQLRTCQDCILCSTYLDGHNHELLAFSFVALIHLLLSPLLIQPSLGIISYSSSSIYCFTLNLTSLGMR